MLCKGPHLSCVVRQVATTFGSSVEAMMAFPDGPLGTPVAPPAPEPTEGNQIQSSQRSQRSRLAASTHICLFTCKQYMFCFYNYTSVLTCMCGVLRSKAMPDDPVEACKWLVPRLTAALSESKILPIRLQHLKHQEVLRNSACFLCT